MSDMGMIQGALALGFALSVVLSLAAMLTLGRHFAQAYRKSVLDSTTTKLSDMFIFMDTRDLMKIGLAATLLIPLVLLIITGNVVLPVLAAIACLFGPRMVHARLRARRRKTLIRQLPDALDSLVGALRAGMSVQQALGLLSEQLPVPSSQEFTLVVRKLRMGVSMDDVLNELEQRIESQEYTMFTTCMKIAREVGGNLTESLERLAETMRKKLAMEGKIDALTSQGKMQGIIVGCLPLFLMWVLAEMEPEGMAPLFNTLIGYGALLVIFLLEVIGFVLIRKIVTIDV